MEPEIILSRRKVIKQLEPIFAWTLNESETFKSVFYGMLCLTPGYWEPIDSNWYLIRMLLCKN